MMMKIEVWEEFPVSADHGIAKGKRTKRQRLSSSAAAAEPHNSLVYSPPATSSGISTSTEEDEDMANCLILLARGDSTPPSSQQETKSSSRIFTEMAISSAGRVGIYVYECKTCNRTFPSFQALGGHRASHKKPKPAADDDQKRRPPPADDQTQDEKQIPKFNLTPQPYKICQTNDQVRPKIHECSICGSEFASGQALGGHMRRHRAPPPLPLIPVDKDNLTHDAIDKPRIVLALDLDLNLPALPEVDKFNQFPAAQPPPMIFSTAALVDCHY